MIIPNVRFGSSVSKMTASARRHLGLRANADVAEVIYLLTKSYLLVEEVDVELGQVLRAFFRKGVSPGQDRRGDVFRYLARLAFVVGVDDVLVSDGENGHRQFRLRRLVVLVSVIQSRPVDGKHRTQSARARVAVHVLVKRIWREGLLSV